MTDINYGAIIVATVVTFIASTIYYVALASVRAKHSTAKPESKPSALQTITEILRILILVVVIALLANMADSKTLGDAFVLTALLWIGFPAMLLSGSVMYEKAPVPLAVLHAGDWLLKLIIITSIIVLWR